MYGLRQALGDGIVAARGEEELGLDETQMWCDALEFEKAVREGRSSAALDLYRGPLLEGLHASGAEFEDWLAEERRRFAELAGDAAWARAVEASEAGDPVLLARWVRRGIGIASLEESRIRRALGWLDDLGDRAGALGIYDEFVSRLKEAQGEITRCRKRHGVFRSCWESRRR